MSQGTQADSAPPAGREKRAVPVSDVLSRSGHELAQLAWLLERLQAHLRPLICEAARSNDALLHHMQSFDHIGQKAAALAEYLAALGAGAPHHWLIDPAIAAKTVKLTDLSLRLGFAEDTNEACSTAWGDCEFF
jgi:hypothetical protein